MAKTHDWPGLAPLDDAASLPLIACLIAAILSAGDRHGSSAPVFVSKRKSGHDR